jgi:HlyD family secretion protein
MSRDRFSRRVYVWLAFAAAIILAGFGTWEWLTVKADRPAYIYGVVDRGDITSMVTSTGTLSAVTTVDVGTQVSGTIAELYADFNSDVKKDQVLARLDQELFLTDVSQQEANAKAAESTLSDDQAATAVAQADVEKAKADLLDKQRKYKRQKELIDESLSSQDDFDTAQAALDAAKATLEAARTEIVSAQARYEADEERLAQSRANLETAKLNLEHSTITSPVAGTVISRNVDRGQTVAADYATPTLFTIGQDLTKMRVNTNIDEADVGKLKIGMQAGFSIDAYPGEVFNGTISQIRLSATLVQNVVTYDAVIDVSNNDLRLKPGMTANVRILVEDVRDVLKIPNSGLRFKPGLSESELQQIFAKNGLADYFRTHKDRLLPPAPLPILPPNGSGNGGRGNLNRASYGRSSSPLGSVGVSLSRTNRGELVPLWILGKEGQLQPVLVKLGLTDGISTQIESAAFKNGDRVITGIEFVPRRSNRLGVGPR